MKYSKLVLSALVALGSTQSWAQTNTLSSIAIAGGSGVVSITQRVGITGNQIGSVGNNLAGMTYAAGNIPGAADTSIALFTLTGGTTFPSATAFTSYGTLISPTAVVGYPDVAALLTATSYAGLTFAIDDLALPIAGSFYTIHHKPLADYFAVIVPKTGSLSTVNDLKPMSWQAVAGATGGPASAGTTGYFALAYTPIIGGGAVTGYSAGSMFYLRTDGSSHVQFGEMIPSLEAASTDKLDLTTAVGSFGVGGYTTLAYSPADLGFGVDQFYYLRQDNGPGGTGNTILGQLNPSLGLGARTISDIANLGGVFSTLTIAVDATGPAGAWGINNFFVTGAPRAASAQSISFAAIADKTVGNVFAVTPTASSTLDLVVTVVSGPATIQTTGVSGATPSLRIFTVTTTGPGVVKLQARQAGSVSPLFTANMLQQSFNVLGLPTVTSAASAPANVGVAFNYAITSTGDPILSYAAVGLPANGLSLNTTTGIISGTPLAVTTMNLTLTSTNATGVSANKALTITVAAAVAPPVITATSPIWGTVGEGFTYNISASGSPTSYSTTALPNGLTFNTTTGVITGTPTTVGNTTVTFGATNLGGTGTKSLTITIEAPVLLAPTVANASASGTAGQVFAGYQISATGSPGSYGASGLPAGLTVNTSTGRITGTPQASGVLSVTITATNASGTGSATLTLTIASVITVTTPPQNQTATVGGNVTFAVAATGPGLTYQWQKNGVAISGAIGATLVLSNTQLDSAGIYSVTTTSGTTTVTTYAVLGFSTTSKVAGGATEVAANIAHPDGKIYDQVLLTGSSAAITADAGQMTRISFLDLNGDIVQVELSGAGTLTLTLEGASGPAVPAKYNQSNVQYMMGHASLVLTGANATTNVSVFSVGTSNAINTTLFKSGEVYDGVADIGLIAVTSANGSFGGVRTANASYFRTSGLTGLYAPGVAFGPVFVGDIGAFDAATPVLEMRSSTDARIAGGDLLQTNNRAVMIDAIAPVRFTAGMRSGGQVQLVQTNRARFEQNGTDVTSQMVAP